MCEYRFHPTRAWRFDYAWPTRHIALEVEGGLHIRGRHVRALGYLRDLEKYNEALRLGWRVLRVAPEWLRTGQAWTWLQALLAEEEVHR